jgi:hypothetical protein
MQVSRNSIKFKNLNMKKNWEHLKALNNTTVGSPFLSEIFSLPYRIVPYCIVSYRTVPYRTVPYRTVPY